MGSGEPGRPGDVGRPGLGCQTGSAWDVGSAGLGVSGRLGLGCRFGSAWDVRSGSAWESDRLGSRCRAGLSARAGRRGPKVLHPSGQGQCAIGGVAHSSPARRPARHDRSRRLEHCSWGSNRLPPTRVGRRSNDGTSGSAHADASTANLHCVLEHSRMIPTPNGPHLRRTPRVDVAGYGVARRFALREAPSGAEGGRVVGPGGR